MPTISPFAHAPVILSMGSLLFPRFLRIFSFWKNIYLISLFAMFVPSSASVLQSFLISGFSDTTSTMVALSLAISLPFSAMIQSSSTFLPRLSNVSGRCSGADPSSDRILLALDHIFCTDLRWIWRRLSHK